HRVLQQEGGAGDRVVGCEGDAGEREHHGEGRQRAARVHRRPSNERVAPSTVIGHLDVDVGDDARGMGHMSYCTPSRATLGGDQGRTASDGIGGQSKGPHVKAQGMSPTSHWAILRASPMLQAPSRFTSHSAGYGMVEQKRAPTSNCAINRASPMFTTPSPVTSPQEKG